MQRLKECDQFDFEVATSVAKRSNAPGIYDSHLPEEWRTGGGIKGGILMATAARATAAAMDIGVEKFFPSSFSASFLTASQAGPVSLRTDIIRRGSRFCTGQVSMSQRAVDGAEVERLRALVSHGNLTSHPIGDPSAPPSITPPEDCVRSHEVPAEIMDRLDILDGVDIRLTPRCAGWVFDAPSRTGCFDGWFRFSNGREPDPLALLVAVDVLPPISFDFGHVGWLPTVQLTAHIRDYPAPGWLQVRTSTKALGDEYVIEDAEVWDSAGALVIQSRRFAAFV
ncbi:thioesterase family protein [Streptomyces cellulosae]|uniref:thioesterase family protein n=1 Tax=Streptomyces cellulosae TaxID=1968 RepID=UPI0004C84F01|nr:thioesterase family protein [Streptomyces cellulosae]